VLVDRSRVTANRGAPAVHMRAFVAAPPEVPTLLGTGGQVGDLLPRVLADVGHPQGRVLPVEGEPPRVAHAHDPPLHGRARWVDAQDLAEVGVGVLPVADAPVL